MRCRAGRRETAGEARLSCRWPQDAKLAGACRSGQHATGGSPPPRRAIARREGLRADPRGLPSRTPTWPTWWKTRTPRFAGCVSCSSGRRTEKTEAVVGRKAEKPEAAVPHDAGAETGLAAGEGNTDESDASGGLQGSRAQRRRGLPGCRADRRAAPVAHRRRRVSGLRPGHRLRQGPGRAGADHRAAAAGGDDLPVAETALPSVRPGLHRAGARRGGRPRSTTPRPAA